VWFHDYEINMCEKFVISMPDYVQVIAGKIGLLITNIYTYISMCFNK